MMIDPSVMDPNVVQAAKAAGLDNVDDLNHNGKIDIQDVALTQSAMPASCMAQPASIEDGDLSANS